MKSNLPVVESCLRNQAAIFQTLSTYFNAESTFVFELGSGTAQHAVYIADRSPNIIWQPSDTEECLAGMTAWVETAVNNNVLAPLVVDVDAHPESLGLPNVDIVFTANTIHFVSEQTARNLIRCASRSLSEGGQLILYGPFNDGDRFTSEGNIRLHQWLLSRDPLSGIKSQQWLASECQKAGFRFEETIAMPANNLILVFNKSV